MRTQMFKWPLPNDRNTTDSVLAENAQPPVVREDWSGIVLTARASWHGTRPSGLAPEKRRLPAVREAGLPPILVRNGTSLGTLAIFRCTASLAHVSSGRYNLSV